METEVKDVRIKKMLDKVYAADFNDNFPSKKGEDITEMSVEDRSFMKLMKKECSKNGKHNNLPLPQKVPEEMFPDNRGMTEARLRNLKKRFSRDKKYHEDPSRLYKVHRRYGSIRVC